MIGSLPTALEIGGKLYAIRSDYRVVLNIYAGFNDPELTNQEKCYVCIKCLYEDYAHIPREHMQEAVDKAYAGVDKISFKDAHFRHDIAHWALERLNK